MERQPVEPGALDRGSPDTATEVRGAQGAALRSDEDERVWVGGGPPSPLEVLREHGEKKPGTASVRRMAGDFPAARIGVPPTSAIVSATSHVSRKKLSRPTRSPTTSDQSFHTRRYFAMDLRASLSRRGAW